MSERNESCWRAIQFAGSGYYTSRSHKLNLASHQWTTLVRMSFYVAFLKFKNHIFLFFSMTTVTVLQTTLLMYTVAAGCFNWYITRKSCFDIFFTASTQRIFGGRLCCRPRRGRTRSREVTCGIHHYWRRAWNDYPFSGGHSPVGRGAEVERQVQFPIVIFSIYNIYFNFLVLFYFVLCVFYCIIVDGCLAYVMRVFLIILKNPFVCSALSIKKLQA